MKKIVTLIALIMIIVYSAKLIIRLNGALAKTISINESKEATTSREEQK